jgi:hypothetical protein
MRNVLVLVLALLAVGTLTACGAGDSASDVLTPEDVAAAAARTADIETYRASFEGTMEVGGTTVEMSGGGEFVAKGKHARMTMSYSGAGANFEMEAVMIWPAFYMRFPAELGSQLPAGKEWVKFDMQKLGKELGIDMNDFMRQANQWDPVQAFAYLQKVADLETVGTEEVRGIETTHFRGAVDLHRVAEADPELKDSIDAMIELTGDDPMPMEVWVSADGLVRRVKQTYVSMQSPGVPPVDMTMQMELYDFGAAVEVTEPPADKVIPLQELMRQANPS